MKKNRTEQEKAVARKLLGIESRTITKCISCDQQLQECLCTSQKRRKEDE